MSLGNLSARYEATLDGEQAAPSRSLRHYGDLTGAAARHDEIRGLADLHAEGVITLSEFNERKRRLLGLEPQAAARAATPPHRSEAIGIALLLLPAAATALFWLWILRMSLLEHPALTAVMVTVGVTVLSAILISIEAAVLGMGGYLGRRRTTGPIAYFFATLLLWVIVYPYYFWDRRRFGVRNLIVPALLVMGVYATSFVLVISAIDAAEKNVRTQFPGLFGWSNNAGSDSDSSTFRTSPQRTSSSADRPRNTVNLWKYDRVKTGMTYSAVVEAIGFTGKEMSRSEFGGSSAVMYAWEDEESIGANMTAMFQDGKLISKAQLGLKW